ncbi:hypothetical protein ACWD0Z_38145, partial [Streptomyces sp. NPDC003007]
MSYEPKLAAALSGATLRQLSHWRRASGPKGTEVPPANWTAGVYAAGTRLCLSKDLVSSGVT